MKTHHTDMKSLSPDRSHTRQFALAKRYSFLLPAVFVAFPALAQQPRDTVVARTVVSTWQKDVDRLRQELLTQRSLELSLFRTLADIEMRRRAVAVPDSQRELQAQAQLLFVKMREASMEQGRIRRQIEMLCAGVRKPEGWIGIATTGFQLQDKRGDGTTFIRFLEPPVVASVDPGSPADRVGVRAGDVLMEIGGQRLLGSTVVFAELLRPGKEIAIKLRRGEETVTLVPMVEPLPQVTTTPCTWVDAGTAYVVAPQPAQSPSFVRVETNPDGTRRYAYEYGKARGDTGVVATSGIPQGGGGVFAGPMAQIYSNGSNILVGLQLLVLSNESSRVLGVSHGILVNQVLPGTPGREAGLQGGDILVMADSVELRSIGHLQRVIRQSADRSVKLVVIRDRKKETVQLKW